MQDLLCASFSDPLMIAWASWYEFKWRHYYSIFFFKNLDQSSVICLTYIWVWNKGIHINVNTLSYLLLVRHISYCKINTVFCSAVLSKHFTMTSVIHINFQASLFMPRLVLQLNAWSRTRSSSEGWWYLPFAHGIISIRTQIWSYEFSFCWHLTGYSIQILQLMVSQIYHKSSHVDNLTFQWQLVLSGSPCLQNQSSDC